MILNFQLARHITEKVEYVYFPLQPRCPVLISREISSLFLALPTSVILKVPKQNEYSFITVQHPSEGRFLFDNEVRARTIF